MLRAVNVRGRIWDQLWNPLQRRIWHQLRGQYWVQIRDQILEDLRC